MAREIFFRGKAINRGKGYHRTNYKNGDWVYGLVTKLYDERFENLPAEMTNTDGISGIDVDYKTIGQYTGLTDSTKWEQLTKEEQSDWLKNHTVEEWNGKKIFEGDICKHRSNYSGEYIISVVTYTDGCFLAMADNNSGFDLSDKLEIIGNIHDNPELLERGCDNG